MAQPVLIRTDEDLREVFETSHERPVLIFKHSLACGASASAHQTWLQFVETRPEDDGITWAVLLIQKTRDLSNEVAARTGIRHQSPQAILLRNGRAVWNASHWSISKKNLQQAVETVAA
jgi:bacillithiol system protein YtxJ